MTDTKEEVVGIILLVLAIAVIFVPLALLIGKVFLTNQENANAQKTIDTLMTKISDLKAGEGNAFTIQGFYGAENWYLTGWGKDEAGRPDKCFFLNGCVCLCNPSAAQSKLKNVVNNFASSPSRTQLAGACQSNGFCKEANFNGVKVTTDYAKLTGFDTNNLPQQLYMKHFCLIGLKNNLLSLSVTKVSSKDNQNFILLIQDYLSYENVFGNQKYSDDLYASYIQRIIGTEFTPEC